jgi:hypothetical protein
VLLWAALHDRTRGRACREANWSTTTLRPAALPSESTVGRRLRGPAVACLLRAPAARPRQIGDPRLLHVIDAKPLPVGGATKDPDARCGRGAGLFAKGYKLYAVWAGRAMPEAWRVYPMNSGENKVAEELIKDLRWGGYLLGDGEYDANGAYDAAGAAGYQLLAPREDPAAGPGHIRQSPFRVRGAALSRSRFGRELLALRRSIEESFGNLTSFGGGLSPLPAWVRRLDRVWCWVAAKLLINGVRAMKDQRLTA